MISGLFIEKEERMSEPILLVKDQTTRQKDWEFSLQSLKLRQIAHLY